MEGDQSLGGAKPDGPVPFSIRDLLSMLQQPTAINKAPGTDTPRDGPPFPKRRKIYGSDYSKPLDPSTKRTFLNPDVDDSHISGTHRGSAPSSDRPLEFDPAFLPAFVHNSQTKNVSPDFNGPSVYRPAFEEPTNPEAPVFDSFASSNKAPSYNAAVTIYNAPEAAARAGTLAYNKVQASNEAAGPETPALSIADIYSKALPYYNYPGFGSAPSDSHNLRPGSFDNGKSAEDAARPQPGRKSGMLLTAGNSRSRNFGSDDGSDTDGEKAESSELTAKYQSLRQPETLTAIQLASKAGFGESSRLALLVKSRGHEDAAMVCHGGWGDYKPPKVPGPVVKRGRGRPRIHPLGQSNYSKRKYGNKDSRRAARAPKQHVANADQQPSLTTQSEVAGASSQELGSSAPTVAGEVDTLPVATSMHLRNPRSIRPPARYSDLSVASGKDEMDEDELAGEGPNPQGGHAYSDPYTPRHVMGTNPVIPGSQPAESAEPKQKRKYTRRSDARPSGRRANPADLNQGSQGLDKKVTTIFTHSGKSVSESNAQIQKAKRSHRRKSSPVEKSPEPVARQDAGESTVVVPESLQRDPQNVEVELSGNAELITPSRAFKDDVPTVDHEIEKTPRTHTRRSSARLISMSPTPMPRGIRTKRTAQTTPNLLPNTASTVRTHGYISPYAGIGMFVPATASISLGGPVFFPTNAPNAPPTLRPFPATASTSLGGPVFAPTNALNAPPTRRPFALTASALSPQQKGWITRRAKQGVEIRQKAGSKTGQNPAQQPAQQPAQTRSSSTAAVVAAAAAAKPQGHRFRLRGPKPPEPK